MKKVLLIVLILLTTHALSQTEIGEITTNGKVQLPLNTYNSLLDASSNLSDKSPVAYAIGQSKVVVDIKEDKGQNSASVELYSKIEIFENKWTSVALLPYGTAIVSARIDNKSIQLAQNGQWLSWNSKKAGTFQLHLTYTVDAMQSQGGYVLPVAIPRAAATTMQVEFPSEKVAMSIIPSTNLSSKSQSNKTISSANIPSTSSVQVSWNAVNMQPYVVSRAQYQGQQGDKSVSFTALFDVEIFSVESVNIPLMPNDITLNEIEVDNKPATILDENGFFTTRVQARGKHKIKVNFQVQIKQQQGPPHVGFSIPEVPVSHFEIKVAGKKELTVMSTNSLGDTSMLSVSSKIAEENTLSSVYLPMAQEVRFSWVDAVPKDVQTKLRANATVYHAISAEEGVLYGQALIDYEITHGETTNLSFTIPYSAQVNRIVSDSGGISDWSVSSKQGNSAESGIKTKTVTVFLDRSIKDNFQLQVYYEQLLKKTEDASPIAISVPLLRANHMHRQRGIVALLTGTELSLKPIEEREITRVGENQLPAFFRNQMTQTIAHTFKYTSEKPLLTVNTIAPIRKKGKYDAQVDTLISLGEVSMRGSSSIQLEVKSGAILDLQLQLPVDINVLNVTGPSIRNYTSGSLKDVKDEQKDKQIIEIEFTQEMTGQFRIEVAYEKIVNEKSSAENKSELIVPNLDVIGSEVQHGRIAVEALTAVEVQTAQSQQLSSLEINELPQQLVLKTTNPILLAFKYVNTETPQRLKLSMTRHQELDVQVAAIESAHYQTLYTNDGLSVTTAKFDVRNSRRQFLRLNLPENSEVWSVFVDGKAEKPALANDSAGSAILIKMLNSVSGFPVVVIYATPVEKQGFFGRIKGQLPSPDMVVTHSYWDIYLPLGPNYQTIQSSMNIVNTGEYVSPQSSATADTIEASKLSSQTRKPMRINVPKQGLKYSFEKLYANQADSVAEFEIRYTSSRGNSIGFVLSIISVLLIWLGLFLLKSTKTSKTMTVVILLTGLIGLLVSLAYFKSDSTVPMGISLLIGGLFVLYYIVQNLRIRS